MHGLKQLIDSPTRITEKTSSLLDHILTNAHEKISQSGVVNVGLSDHQMIYCTRKIWKQKFKNHKDITIRSLKNYSQEIFINSLTELKYPNYSHFTDVDFAYEDFIRPSQLLTKLLQKRRFMLRAAIRTGLTMRSMKLLSTEINYSVSLKKPD